MSRHLVALLLLLTATISKGLTARHEDFHPCSGDRDSFMDGILCDPDHLLSPEESHNTCLLLAQCGDAGGVKVMVVLAANFTFNVNSGAPGNAAAPAPTASSGDGSARESINLLKELVVASSKLNSSTTTTTTSTIITDSKNKTSTTSSTSCCCSSSSSSSVILLVAIKDPFQLATWHSVALDGVLTQAPLEEAKQRVNITMDKRHFTSSVVHVAHQLCTEARPSQSSTPRDKILTVVWIAFTAAFITLLVVIVVTLLRVRHRAVTSVHVQGRHEHGKQPVTSTSDIQEFSVLYKSTGKVLLGTTDLTAIAAQDCSSTDNLLPG